jgi:hypothetical protein
MILVRDDTTAVEAKWVPTSLGLDVPFLSVGGRVISFAEPLRWYQWAWAGWSVVVLVVAGNIIGMIPGLLATLFNIQVFRSELSRWLQYLITVAASILALLVYRAIALYLPRLAVLWS